MAGAALGAMEENKIKQQAQFHFLVGQDHAVNDMDHTIVGRNVRGGDCCFVNHDTACGGNGQLRALHGFNFDRFHVCCHHFAGNDVVSEYRSELGFVFEQGIQVGFGNFCKGFICGCKHCEWALAFEGVNQTCGGSVTACAIETMLTRGFNNLLCGDPLSSGLRISCLDS